MSAPFMIFEVSGLESFGLVVFSDVTCWHWRLDLLALDKASLPVRVFAV